MDQVNTLDLETLEPKAARRAVKEMYGSVRSAQARSLLANLLRPYFQNAGGRKQRAFFLGITVLGKNELEQLRLFNDKLSLHGALCLVIGADVSPELAAETIESISMAGLIFASDAVWDVLRDRCTSGLRL